MKRGQTPAISATSATPAATADATVLTTAADPLLSTETALTYDRPGLRKALQTTAGPVSRKAKIKLNLQAKSDVQLLPFCRAISAAMAGNANFPAPVPSAELFNAAVADFAAKLKVHSLAQVAARKATTEKNTARALMTELLNTRANYVLTESNGNAAIIRSAAMPVRSTPNPVGHLLPPLNLRIDLNGQAGVMILRWNRVAKALSYFVQCADATTDERVWTDLKTISNRKLILTDMEIGKMYAFRVAAIGGSAGQSLWCPEVLRMAA